MRVYKRSNILPTKGVDKNKMDFDAKAAELRSLTQMRSCFRIMGLLASGWFFMSLDGSRGTFDVLLLSKKICINNMKRKKKRRDFKDDLRGA